jgi:hypothetical protein
MLILNIFLYRKSCEYFSRKTYSKYSRRVRTTAPPNVARLNTEIPCITNLYIYSNIYAKDSGTEFVCIHCRGKTAIVNLNSMFNNLKNYKIFSKFYCNSLVRFSYCKIRRIFFLNVIRDLLL